MKIPGFIAEASLYRTSGYYRAFGNLGQADKFAHPAQILYTHFNPSWLLSLLLDSVPYSIGSCYPDCLRICNELHLSDCEDKCFNLCREQFFEEGVPAIERGHCRRLLNKCTSGEDPRGGLVISGLGIVRNGFQGVMRHGSDRGVLFPGHQDIAVLLLMRLKI